MSHLLPGKSGSLGRQEYSKRQLHLQNFGKGGMHRRYGGTTHPGSYLCKGDIIQYYNKTGYVGGWAKNGKVVSLTNSNGTRVHRVGAGTVKLLWRSPNILVRRRRTQGVPLG